MRSMTRALLLVLACAGPAQALACKRSPQAAPQGADAGAADSAVVLVDAAPPPDRTLRVVAAGVIFDSRVVVDGQSIFVASGPLVQEARPSGELVVLGGLAAYKTMLPEGETIVGYGDPVPSVTAITREADGSHLLHTSTEKGFKLDAGKIAATSVEPLRSLVSWKGKAVGLDWSGNVKWAMPGGPTLSSDPSVQATQLAVDASGRLVVFGRRGDVDTALVIEAPGAAPKAVEFPAPGALNCLPVPSLDRRVYAVCDFGRQLGAPAPRVLRLDGTTWTRVFDKAKADRCASVGADGAFYACTEGKLGIVRCTLEGECTPLQHGSTDLPRGRPRYQLFDTDVVDPSSRRTWATVSIRVIDHSVDEVYVEHVFARSADDVWVFGYSGGVKLVLHTGPAPKSIARLPSSLDARVSIRNESPPAAWVGACDQLFVRLGPATEEAAIVARGKEIQHLLATPSDPSPDAWLVTGRLHGAGAVGVVVARPSIDTSAKVFERAVNRLADKLAKNPVDRPEITCTLPVLEKLHAM